MTNQSTNTTPDSGANNQLTVNEQLDKILLDFACDVEDANKLGDDAIRHLNIKLREAKTKLQRLIVEAELSELNALIPIDGLRRADSFDNSVFVVKVGGIHDRIAQLEEELLDRLLEHGEDFTTFGDGCSSVAVEYIEAERNKLKEKLNE